MSFDFETGLLEWQLPTIRDIDIATTFFFQSAEKRYAAVNRALKKGLLIRLRRRLYIIDYPFRQTLPSPFEIAHTIYGPSYISFESALLYHQWIPEAVYQTTCATTKRANAFETPLGIFQYAHVPVQYCYLGVERIGEEKNAFFMANPWKAIA